MYREAAAVCMLCPGLTHSSIVVQQRVITVPLYATIWNKIASCMTALSFWWENQGHIRYSEGIPTCSGCSGAGSLIRPEKTSICCVMDPGMLLNTEDLKCGHMCCCLVKSRHLSRNLHDQVFILACFCHQIKKVFLAVLSLHLSGLCYVSLCFCSCSCVSFQFSVLSTVY